MARIFWDTNLFIYLFESNPTFGPHVQELRRRMLSRGDRLYTSTFAVGEILVKPFGMGQPALADRYLQLLSHPTITLLSFDLKAASRYAEIRQDRSISRPDAVQLACAAAAGMDLFVTNDDRLKHKAVPGVNFITGLERAPL